MEPTPPNAPDRRLTMLALVTATLKLALVVSDIIARLGGIPPA